MFIGLLFGPANLLVTRAATNAGSQNPPVTIREIARKVEIQRAGSAAWDPAYVDQTLTPGDRIRTGEGSRAALQMRDLSIVRLKELSVLAIAADEPARTRFQLLQGLLYFFNRGRPGEAEVGGGGVSAVVRGTEFTFEVTENGESTLRLIDGKVELSNPLGRVELSSGETGHTAKDRPPIKLPALQAQPEHDLQWFLYYPAVLDPEDLNLQPAEAKTLDPVLAAYRTGDLRLAWAKFQEIAPANSDPVFLLQAALDLSFGNVPEASALLDRISREGSSYRVAEALRLLITAIRNPKDLPTIPVPEKADALLSTEWLARSYALQSLRDLHRARHSARMATERSPSFGFTHARLAEMEFSFARTRQAGQAADLALKLSPSNAQAWALRGFLLSAAHRMEASLEAFHRAIAVDGGLANGWLGRGLVLIRQGNLYEGRLLLQIAAAMEPKRAMLRSYLGKAFDAENNDSKARHELELARSLDSLDPTSWLYSALIHQNSGRVNDAINDLQRSIELNSQRAVYRSTMLLEQDRSVRSASLANVFKDAGFVETAQQKASEAVVANYASPSAHLFLAQSYLNADRVHLRHESARIGEFLAANLLAPGGAAPFSSTLSQQEYSALLERDGFGLFSQTDYHSRGRWSESAAALLVSGPSSFSLDGFRLSDPGYRPNNRLEADAVSLQYRQQLGTSDTLFFQPYWSATESGDLIEYYDPTHANAGYRSRETQSPIFLAGWRHDWNPGVHTLVLISHLQNSLEQENPASKIGVLSFVDNIPHKLQFPEFSETSKVDFQAFSAEIQQIVELERSLTVIGARLQEGRIETESDLHLVSRGIPSPSIPQGLFTMDAPSDRISAYVMQSVQVTRYARFTAGMTYDRMEYPRNFRSGPVASDRETTDRISPKAGLILTPHRTTTLRFAYAPSLGGVGFDQSFKLEPTQVAGINQAYRSLIPESIAGSSSAERFDTWGAALSQSLGHSTWLTVKADWLESKADQDTGSFEGSFSRGLSAGVLRQRLAFQEKSLAASVNTLLGRDWAAGISYRVSEAGLNSSYQDVALPLSPGRQGALLQLARGYLLMNHPSGFFLHTEALWTHQSLREDLALLPDEDYWQFNVFAGYRFYKRRAEIRLGLLNVTDTDFRIHPISVLAPMPRERTFTLTFKWRL